MKLAVTLKNPDAFDNAVDAIADGQLDLLDLTDEQKFAIRDIRVETIKKKLGEWVFYGEYITVDFDLIEMTATVRKCKK